MPADGVGVSVVLGDAALADVLFLVLVLVDAGFPSSDRFRVSGPRRAAGLFRFQLGHELGGRGGCWGPATRVGAPRKGRCCGWA